MGVDGIENLKFQGFGWSSSAENVARSYLEKMSTLPQRCPKRECPNAKSSIHHEVPKFRSRVQELRHRLQCPWTTGARLLMMRLWLVMVLVVVVAVVVVAMIVGVIVMAVVVAVAVLALSWLCRQSAVVVVALALALAVVVVVAVWQ